MGGDPWVALVLCKCVCSSHQGDPRVPTTSHHHTRPYEYDAQDENPAGRNKLHPAICCQSVATSAAGSVSDTLYASVLEISA